MSLDPDTVDWPGLAASAEWLTAGLAYDPTDPANRHRRKCVADGAVVEGLAGPREATFDSLPGGVPGTPTGDECDGLVAKYVARFTDPPTDVRGQRMPLPATDPFAAEVLKTVKAANQRWWRLDVDAWQVSLAQYERGCMVPLHVDNYPGRAAQKISASVQLSDPDDYSGGDLLLDHSGYRPDGEFFDDRWFWTPLEQGTVTVWPSWVAHQVRPVTEGTRWALVLWGWGPAFR